MLQLQSKEHDWIIVGDVIINLIDVQGKQCKIGIQAPREVPIIRDDIIQRKLLERGWRYVGLRIDGDRDRKRIKIYRNDAEDRVCDILTLIRELNIKEMF